MSNENRHLKIQYIGQVGVILHKNDITIAIDPYLTDSVDHFLGSRRAFVRGDMRLL